ncbi:TonB-dependent receptor [Tenacibaculum skagerrakense]|uniref:TonB-dependent receptor n=1 Tax=Tenacibaculum skagerrakense TaxID=186571 RepID=A0A4R2NN04_9FLAO|nr:TonB-dependent receptor [Tenacibaculum skagerrakense]TCP22961.1 TonB-dependent receptor [Tenacibaculum skagerrakense]
MKQSSFLKLLFVTLIGILFNSKVAAQTGTISGIITDENGIYLPGATVLLDQTFKGTNTDFDGKFTLLDVKVGKHIINVTFIGYEKIQKEVIVIENSTAIVKIILKPNTTLLDEITISTAIGGEAKAINKQKSNTNITNVISTDQIGKFPDANIGDAVKRVPGITMQVDQGEARNIIVRGLSPQLNSVTLNGSRIPSAEGDNRNIQMDLIPSDMIQTIEVNKAVTPDMDADALGGSVNLVTRTAPQSFRLSATAGSGMTLINNRRILNGSFLVGDRTEDKKVGWMLSASINDTDFESHNIEAEWDNEFEYNTGVQDTSGDDILQEVDVNPYSKEFQQRTYLVQRVRRSIAGNFDFQLDNNNTIYIKSMYNWRDDRENRLRLKQEILDGEDISLGDFVIDANNNLTRFPVEVSRETKGGINNSRNKSRRLEDQRMQNYTLGGDHLFNNLKVDWLASYARASEQRSNERYASFQSEYIINNRNSNPRFPFYTPVDAAFANDLSNFEFDEITEENQYTQEEDYNFFANLQLPLQMFNSKDGILKFGLRTRLKTKERDNNFFEFDLESAFPTLNDAITKDYTKGNFLAGSRYEAGRFASEEWLGDLNLSNGDPVFDEYLGENFLAKEDVYAGYIMTEQKVTDQFTVLAGVRIESTRTVATGNIVNYDSDGDFESFVPVTDKGSYTNILPSVHLKYSINPKTIIRFAYTNTIARPNYVELVPFRNILREDDAIELGNPDLDPAKSMNLDLSAEYYFDDIGLISVGVFYKDIKDFSYVSFSQATDNSLGSNTQGFTVFRPENGDDATVLGAEFAFQKKLNFLPGFARNFNVYANYTFLTSEANGVNDRSNNLELPNTAPNMFNGSLGYDDGKLTARISANFSDAYIDEFGGSEFEDRFYDKQFFLDFNVGYAITNNLRLYADFTNITDQPLRFYQGAKERTMQVEYYGRRLTLGLKYDLFKK